MSRIKRRQFLQFASSALATIGLSQLDLQQQGVRYGKALAQDTPRKLALLVGINKYPESDRFSNLGGCVTDVELQKHLLIHRFGFNKNDILTLTDAQASRQGILEAFEEHLIKQAKPGDVAIFHFSGHGSRVADPNPLDPSDPENGTLVPADDGGFGAGSPVVNDIMGQTLFLLRYALRQKTENVTVVFDSCHAGSLRNKLQNEVKPRVIEQGERASEAEFEYQQQWLSKLNLTPEQFQSERRKGAGAFIASARGRDFAADYRFEDDFYAGAFTFLLAQYLWQDAPDVNSTVDTVKQRIKSLSRQVPVYQVQTESPTPPPIYFLKPALAPAEAVVLDVKSNNEAIVWLGGANEESLAAFGEGAELTPVSSRGGSGKIQIQSRQGLLGRAKIQGTVQPGELLQESSRAIPMDWKLGIGIDPSLSSERSAIAAALQSIERIEAIPAQAANRPYPKKVQYILSRATPAYREYLRNQGAQEIPPEGSIGLFSPALERIPKSFGPANESASQAMGRLLPKLKGLLASRIIKLTLNAQSSRLAVGVSMSFEKAELENSVDDPLELVGESFSTRGCHNTPKECKTGGSRDIKRPLQRLPINRSFHFEVINEEPKPLYIGVLVIDAAGEIVVLFPNQFQEFPSEEERVKATRIEGNSMLRIPDPNQGDTFVLETTELGVGEVLVIASQQPLNEALSKLRVAARGQRGPVAASEPMTLIGDLIGDVSTRGGGGGTTQGYRQVSATNMAALSIAFEVIPE